MTIKEYLQQKFILEKRIQDKEDELNELRAKIESAKSQKFAERVQTTQNVNNNADMIVEMLAFEEEIEKQKNDLIKLSREISKAINNVEKQEYKRVLELRYLKCLKWDDVADKMNVSERQVHRIHSKALKCVEM